MTVSILEAPILINVAIIESSRMGYKEGKCSAEKRCGDGYLRNFVGKK